MNPALFAVTARLPLDQAEDALTAEAVKRELYGAQDDMGEWASAQWASRRVAQMWHAEDLDAERALRHEGAQMDLPNPCDRCRVLGVCQRSDCNGSGPRMPTRRNPRKRNRWSRTLRNLWRFLMQPRAW